MASSGCRAAFPEEQPGFSPFFRLLGTLQTRRLRRKFVDLQRVRQVVHDGPGPAKAWGGVFSVPTDERMEAFSESVSYDCRLADDDIAGSTAHAKMLAACGIISAEEAEQIVAGLAEIGREIAEGRFPFSTKREDIHLNIEAVLTERIGDTGRKLHTARSRNDQVATDLRLFCRRAIDRLDAGLEALQRSFLDLATREQDLVIPAYTHLRRAQPVLAAHQLLGWCEKFDLDRERLAD